MAYIIGEQIMTSLYQNIQTLGNKMAANLTTMGVESSFSEGGLTLADKILDINYFKDGVILSGDKTIEQSGNVVSLTAMVLVDGVFQIGKTILFEGVPASTTTVTGDVSPLAQDLGGNYWTISSTTGGEVYFGTSSFWIGFTKTSTGWEVTRSGYTPAKTISGDKLTYIGGGIVINENGNTLDLSTLTNSSAEGIASWHPYTLYGYYYGTTKIDVLATAVTNSDGIATADYTCTGAGKKTFRARVIE